MQISDRKTEYGTDNLTLSEYTCDSGAETLRLDSAKKSKINGLKDRMLKIKKAAKKCKRFVQKCEKKKGVVGGGSGE